MVAKFTSDPTAVLHHRVGSCCSFAWVKVHDCFSYVQSKDSQNGNVFSSFCSHFAVLARHAAHIVTDGESDGQTFRFSTNVISFQKCSVICLAQPVYPDKLLICAFAAPHLPHKNIFFYLSKPIHIFHAASHICHAPPWLAQLLY